jgi:hypothetical protein
LPWNCSIVSWRAESDRSPELVADRVRGSAQVVGGEVRPEVGAVAKDRAVLHQAVAEEDLLALADVVAGVDRRAARIDCLPGDRRIGLIGAIGQQAEDEEPDQDDERRDL